MLILESAFYEFQVVGTCRSIGGKSAEKLTNNLYLPRRMESGNKRKTVPISFFLKVFFFAAVLGPPSLVLNRYQILIFIEGLKRLEREAFHLPPMCTEVKWAFMPLPGVPVWHVQNLTFTVELCPY
jgi:hypothetical protein